MTSHLRPSFFIIGERKCGTSSLFRYLLDHPNILPGDRKEMQFFTKGEQHVREHFEDYLARYPTTHGDERAVIDWPELNSEGVLFEERLRFARAEGHHYITGEASADTLCDVAPELVREYLPGLALIALLRDPVQRAFSHHRMFKRFHEEGRELPFVPGDFASDMRTELRSLEQGEITPCLSPSIYVHNLVRWADVWKEKLLVVFTSQLGDPTTYPTCMDTIVSHLGLPPHPYVFERRYNKAPEADMPEDIRDELRAFFAPHDRALEAHLGRPLPWLS